MREQSVARARADAATLARIEDLLRRMTLPEKLGQLNMPMPLPPPALAMLEPDSGHPSSLADVEAAVDGHLADGVGPAGGFFIVETFGFQGGPAEQAALKRALQKRAASTRLGVPLLFICEGTHGVQATGATVFPEGPGLGSTWNPELICDVYAAIAAEARATGNHMLCTLVIEPIRDPRLGRNSQAYTEDPYLNSVYARAIVAGVEGDSLADDRARAIVTHFPGQSEPVGGMERGAVELSERVLREVYLPAWFAAAGPDGAAGVMATYATVDGMPIHGHRKWLRDVLRDEIGFAGITFSEGFGFETLQYEGIVETQREAGVLAIRAGVDVSITWESAYRGDLGDAVRDGTASEADVDNAVRRVLAVKHALGLFDDPEIGIDPGVAHSPAHTDLALRAARESLVLLKNDGELLPLSGDISKVAVIGPNADNARNLLGDYVASTISQPVPTILDTLRARLGSDRVAYARGCDLTDHDDVTIDEAVRVARDADVAIVVLGERSGEMFFDDPTPTNGERHDLSTLDLTGAQQQLLEAIHATGTPVVLVLVNGRPLAVRWGATHVPVIIEAWLPGERGADAVADVLLGDYNPSGRLSVTVPRSAGHLPAYYNAKRSKTYWIDQGGYVDGDTSPLFSFGHGLSFAAVRYDDLTVTVAHGGGTQTGHDHIRSPAGVAKPDAAQESVATVTVVTVQFTLHNDGDRDTIETPQLYVRDRHSSVATPERQLRRFAKVALAAGTSERVTFTLTAGDLALLDLDGRWTVEAGIFDLLIGASSTDIRLRRHITVSERIVFPRYPTTGLSHP